MREALAVLATVLFTAGVLKLLFYDPPSGYNMGTGDSIALPFILIAAGGLLFWIIA